MTGLVAMERRVYDAGASIGPVSSHDRADVVIVGGAIVGSSVATFLALRPDWHGRIVVVERDPTFRTSSTTLSAASIRQQFSTPLNIEISRFGVQVIRDPGRWLAVDGQPAPVVDFVEGGYLFLATEAGLPILESNHAVQLEHGVQVALLTPTELLARFPWLYVEDLAGGSLGLADEGWFDAYALLQAFRRKARSLGVEEVAGEVVEIERDGEGATGVRLADGRVIAADWVVNAAGPRAGQVAAMAGLQLPVSPRKRMVFHFDCRTRVESPLTIDTSGVYFRPEGPNYIAGSSPHGEQPDPDTLDLEVERSWFDEVIWPAIAHRVPAFEAIRLLDAWAGHYEVNTLDHNAVIGPHPEVPNFLFANGFSGHGLQQAPAAGRALSEWIATGDYETIDVRPLGYERIAANEPYRELNVI
jgi:FAD-dependent oxidoreductase domain-containing protein 1